ncbi:hypothetical protein BJ742DRAFT_803032 [Cladochytrium replicatum]|nr:hypothetical protein BJ742DRAFT_803032 [Cladochytrium replicatum]
MVPQNSLSTLVVRSLRQRRTPAWQNRQLQLLTSPTQNHEYNMRGRVCENTSGSWSRVGLLSGVVTAVATTTFVFSESKSAQQDLPLDFIDQHVTPLLVSAIESRNPEKIRHAANVIAFALRTYLSANSGKFGDPKAYGTSWGGVLTREEELSLARGKLAIAEILTEFPEYFAHERSASGNVKVSPSLVESVRTAGVVDGDPLATVVYALSTGSKLSDEEAQKLVDGTAARCDDWATRCLRRVAQMSGAPLWWQGWWPFSTDASGETQVDPRPAFATNAFLIAAFLCPELADVDTLIAGATSGKDGPAPFRTRLPNFKQALPFLEIAATLGHGASAKIVFYTLLGYAGDTFTDVYKASAYMGAAGADSFGREVGRLAKLGHDTAREVAGIVGDVFGAESGIWEQKGDSAGKEEQKFVFEVSSRTVVDGKDEGVKRLEIRNDGSGWKVESNGVDKEAVDKFTQEVKEVWNGKKRTVSEESLEAIMPKGFRVWVDSKDE